MPAKLTAPQPVSLMSGGVASGGVASGGVASGSRGMVRLELQRTQLAFRAVNRRDAPDYQPGLQRHHILPRQVLTRPSLAPMFSELGKDRIGFDDFRRNGLLLPASDHAAVRIGLPLHRGPHRTYNELVLERIGQIEAGWAAQRRRAPELALNDALARLELLQRALRRRLLDQRRRLRLNRRDPLGSGVDFTELDAMAAMLWPATASDQRSG